MNDTTPTPAAPEPLDDDALRDLRADLDAGANCVIAYTARSLLARLDQADADRDRLRRQLDAAEAAPVTVWWLEGDDERPEPDVYATPELAKAAGIAAVRKLNPDDEFPDRAFDWTPDHDSGLYELLMHDCRTGITVCSVTVQGAAQTSTEQPARADLTRYPIGTHRGQLALWCSDDGDPTNPLAPMPFWTEADAAEQVTELCLANLVAIAAEHERKYHADDDHAVNLVIAALDAHLTNLEKTSTYKERRAQIIIATTPVTTPPTRKSKQ